MNIIFHHQIVSYVGNYAHGLKQFFKALLFKVNNFRLRYEFLREEQPCCLT
jgi:hypothetical protein